MGCCIPFCLNIIQSENNVLKNKQFPCLAAYMYFGLHLHVYVNSPNELTILVYFMGQNHVHETVTKTVSTVN